MRVSLEEWRLSFFWLEAETNLCVQGSGLCGTAGGQAVPFPPLGALGLSRGGPGPTVHPLPWREGFGSFLFLLAFPLGPCPERAVAAWQLGGCHHSN